MNNKQLSIAAICVAGAYCVYRFASTRAYRGPDCCPPESLPNAAPVENEAHGVGEEEQWGNLCVYVTRGATKEVKRRRARADSEPSQLRAGDAEAKPKAAIIVLYDIFGFYGGRTRLLCDELAERTGIVVVLPDLFHGNPPLLPPRSFNAWWTKLYMLFSLPSALQYLKQTPYKSFEHDLFGVCVPRLEEAGARRIGVFGQCWGGWLAMHASASTKIAAAAAAHSSLNVTGLLGESLEAVVRAAKCPQLLAQAGNDPPATKPGGDVERWLHAEGIECHVKAYETQQHGFLTRGGAIDEQREAAIRDVMNDVVSFFKRHLLK